VSRRPILFSTAALLGLASAAAWAPPVASAAAQPASSAACRSALNDTGSHRVLGTGTPVWRRAARTFVGVAGHSERGRYRLRVCTAAPSEVEQASRASDPQTTRTVQAEGRTITVERDGRVREVAVADPWITWTTTRPGQQGFRIARRTIDGKRSTSRQFRGSPYALVVTRDGTVVLSSREGNLQRVYRWTTSGTTKPLITPRSANFANNAPGDQGPVEVSLWDPDTIELTPPGHNAPPQMNAALPSGSLVSTTKTKPCRNWGSAGEGDGTPKTTRDLVATLTDSTAWSRTSEYVAGSGWQFVGWTSQLEICAPRTRARLLAVPAGYDTADSDSDGLTSVRIAGDAVLASGYSGGGYTGSGASGGPLEVGYVRPQSAGQSWTQVAGHNLATRAAAAWTQDASVWVSDAAGTRPIAALPPGFTGLRIVGGTLTIVSAVGEQRIPLAPLPADRTSAGLRNSAANFGICTDQFSNYCPDPSTPGKGPATP
jgi:hypothetical protein